MVEKTSKILMCNGDSQQGTILIFIRPLLLPEEQMPKGWVSYNNDVVLDIGEH